MTNKKRNTRVKAVRDERYRISDIKTSVRSELQGSEFVGILGGEGCNDNLHLNCGHRDITNKFITVKPVQPTLTYTEKETANKFANKELSRMILRLRDWSVLNSKARQSYTMLHPLYLKIAEMTPIAWGNTEIHKYRHRR
tara:strand:+ start:7275 stop:7694 length:420 start_codon:yes stop_codon:yes gene_type:complete